MHVPHWNDAASGSRYPPPQAEPHFAEHVEHAHALVSSAGPIEYQHRYDGSHPPPIQSAHGTHSVSSNEHADVSAEHAP